MAIYNEEIDGNLIVNSVKNDLIVEIKEIVKNYGGFSTGEVQADHSPTVQGQRGNLTHLIEYFNQDDVDVEVYDDEIEVDSYSLKYEELDEETLEYILELVQVYQQQQEENEY